MQPGLWVRDFVITVKVKAAQSCLTLCDPVDDTVYGIFQAKILQDGKIPWRRERLPTPVFWLREFHGLYHPWGSQRVVHNWTTFTSLHFVIAQFHVLLPSFLFKNSMVSHDIIGELNKGPVEHGKIQKEHGWDLYWDHIVYHGVWLLSNK